MTCAMVFARETGSKKVLVAYFSATGNTERVAKSLAAVTGGTLYRIQPEKSYTAADLDWNDKRSRSYVEMHDAAARPALVKDLKDAADYEVIYLGYPIWWDQAPKIINAFLESYDLEGKTIIPFATSGSSRIDNSEKALRKAYPRLRWEAGKRLNGATEESLREWIKK